MSIRGKNVVVTCGGDGDEVSFDLALSLARNGCRLVLAGNASELGNTAKRVMKCVEGEGQSADIVRVVDLDANDSEAHVDVAIHNAWQMLGQIDSLITSYTYHGTLTPPLELTEDELDKVIKINLKGTWLVCKAVGKRMRDYGTGGSFILITTIIGTERGLYPGAAAYGASLAGINHLARALAMELGKYKIRVNAVARGLHNSDAFLQAFSEDKREKSVKEIVPLQRWLDVKTDLAPIVLYLISDDSSFMTGSVNFIDGGQSIVRPRMRSFM